MPPPIRFGEFTLDAAARQLLRDGREVHLEPKAFDLLALLASERPRALSKAAIRARLWPGTFVSESSLTTLVAALRAILQDAPRRPRFLRTVYGFGYAFCGEAAPDAPRRPRTRFRILWDEREFPLAEGENVLGRAEDAAVALDAASVCRRHARIVVSGALAVLEDLSSKNGTSLRGRTVHGPVELSDGDDIRLGRIRVTFRASARAASTATEAGG